MTDLQREIKGYLSQFSSPVPRRQLLVFLNAQGWTITDSSMRREIQAAVEAGELIGSTHKGTPGYYIIRNVEDAILAAEERANKARTELKIANLILKNANRRFGGQMSFTFDVKVLNNVDSSVIV